MYRIITFSFCLFLLISCGKRGGNGATVTGEPLEMRYSHLLSMCEHDGIVTAEVRNPWDTASLLHRYVLVPADRALPERLPEGEVIRTPLRNTAVYTSVHCALIDELGAADAIRGVCDLQYIYLQKIRQGVRNGNITDLGNSMTPNIELLMAMRPDAMFISPFENSGSYGKLGKLHIPIIECADYMETNPLGRAEWLRFYGRLFGKQREADSIFAAVESRYNSMKATVRGKKTRPTVVTEMKIGSTWYVAGKNSTVGILISDAGGDYIFSDVAGSGAVPYNPEQVLQRAHKADFWLIKYNQATDMTMQELAQAWASNRFMEAYKRGNVFGCNLGKTHFFEETPFHPDVLLREFINILHPGAQEENAMKYYFRLKVGG